MSERGSSLQVYTDGSCLPGNHGGYSFIVLSADRKSVYRFQSGYIPEATNNIAELEAILQSLIKLPDVHVDIHTDSKYCIDALSLYYKIWEKNNWVTSLGEPVRNKDLIMAIRKLMHGRKVSFVKVKGHAGDPFNTMCDYLAKSAAMSKGG